MGPDRALLEEVVRTLAAQERPSASDGERRAAEWIADRLRSLGAEARLEEERAHGGYWGPLGTLAGGAALAGLVALRGGRRARWAASLVAASAAAAVWDDVGGGRLWFRARALRSRTTTNVIAEAGDREATRTLVFVAHHDAAHSGLIFHPGIPETIGRRFPGLLERGRTHPPVMGPVFAGPALVAAGALAGRRGLTWAGVVVSVGVVAFMVDIGVREVVPGANDNATAVAVLAALAAGLRDDPVPGVRVVLLSTGSEESFMEGMQGFVRRHRERLDPRTTAFVALDSVGSPELALAEGEGMLRMRDFTPELKDELEECAARLGIPVHRGLRSRFATDGLISLRAGYPSAMVGSITRFRMPSNYHWPTDVPENVDFSTVEDAVRLCRALVERRGAGTPAAAPAGALSA